MRRRWLLPALLLAHLVAAAHQRAAAEDGAALYRESCAMCHQIGAVGLSGQYPRLAGRIHSIAANPLGRKYLLDVVLDGMTGQIEIDGTRIFGVMPSFRSLQDAQIAAILSYLAALPDGAPAKVARFQAREVDSARREPQQPPAALRELRAELHKQGVVP